MVRRISRIALVGSTVLALSSISYRVLAHGNVTPQAVEGSELPEPVEGRTFTVGADRFRRTSRPL